MWACYIGEISESYVKVEENKIYWTSDKDAGSVDIW